MDSIKSARRWIKNLKFSKVENVVRNATCDNSNPIAKEDFEALRDKLLRCSLEDHEKIYNLWKKRATDYRCHNHVHKALQILEYLIDELPDQLDTLDFFLDVKKDISCIQKLTKYRFYDESDIEIAQPVRSLALEIKRRLQTNEIPTIPSAREDDIMSIHARDQIAYYDEHVDGFQIIGCLGSNANYINGTYLPTGDYLGDKPAFERDSGSEMEDPIMFWYWSKHSAWMICRASLIGSQVAYAIVKTDVHHPLAIDIPFLVYDMGSEKFDVDETMKVVPLN